MIRIELVWKQLVRLLLLPKHSITHRIKINICGQLMYTVVLREPFFTCEGV